MAKKAPSIASLVRSSAVSESALVATLIEAVENEDADRVYDIFSRITVPKEFTDERTDENAATASDINGAAVGFPEEADLSRSFNLFIDRHIRKLRWHASHPASENVASCLHIYSVLSVILEWRARRVLSILNKEDVLTAEEWGTAREYLNRTYRDFREATKVVVHRWIPAVMESCDPEEIQPGLEGLDNMIRDRARSLSSLRDEIEERRHQMGVQPVGYPIVRPPRYFGGDLLSDESWRLLWGDVNDLADITLQTVEG